MEELSLNDQQIIRGACQEDQLKKLHPGYQRAADARISIKKVLITGIAGTTAMTVFSYLVSAKKDQNFREPELLGRLLTGARHTGKTASNQSLGWTAHYAAGILFSAGQWWLQNRLKAKPSVASGIASGVISGIVGVGMWESTFAVQPSPPKAGKLRFFSHLVLAHIVFSVTVNLCGLAVKKRT